MSHEALFEKYSWSSPGQGNSERIVRFKCLCALNWWQLAALVAIGSRCSKAACGLVSDHVGDALDP